MFSDYQRLYQLSQVSRTTSAVGASNTRFAVARLTSLLKLRIRERDPLVTSPEQASVKFWTNIIVAAMEEREVFAFARVSPYSGRLKVER